MYAESLVKMTAVVRVWFDTGCHPSSFVHQNVVTKLGIQHEIKASTLEHSTADAKGDIRLFT